MTTLEFQLHIDPSLYSFKFNDAQYATVSYATSKVRDSIEVIVFGIQLGPSIFCLVTDREKLVAEAESAAKKHAEKYWREQPADYLIGIVKGFAPHI